MNTEFFYRYRSIPRLLDGSRELESHSIYFATPEQLNDPMEGYQDLVWDGDFVLWKNLIRHYVLTLQMAASYVIISGPEFALGEIGSIVRWSASKLPTQAVSELHNEICSSLFCDGALDRLLGRISVLRRRVRRNELRYYLNAIHPIALKQTIAHMVNRGLLKPAIPPNFDFAMENEALAQITELLDSVERTSEIKSDLAADHPSLFEATVLVQEQLLLSRLRQHKESLNLGWRLLCFEFPEFYCNNVARTLYPAWYAACFVKDPTHAAMWAHYGDSHRGVCLQFRATESKVGTSVLGLRGTTGWSSGPRGSCKVKGFVEHSFIKMNYRPCFPEIDFFRSIGRLSVSALLGDWFTANGKESEVAETVFWNEEVWRRAYWGKLIEIATTKFLDWQYEDEYRLVLHPTIQDELDDEDRLLTYDFASLNGIIFGAETKLEDKLRIVRIVQEKCYSSGRKDFAFMQAHYSPRTSRFELSELPLLSVA